MRPHALFWNQQIKRAHAIVERLAQEDIDVIVFQEVFDRKVQKVLRRGLSERYPHQHGPGRKGLFHLNSGVWILSKYPFVQTNIEQFDDCAREDCIARKSVVFAELQVPCLSAGRRPKLVQILGAHLQAISGDKYDAIRESQMKEMAMVRDETYTKGVPQVFAGDMNTAVSNTERYTNMLQVLDCEDGRPMGSIQLSSRSGQRHKQEAGV